MITYRNASTGQMQTTSAYLNYPWVRVSAASEPIEPEIDDAGDEIVGAVLTVAVESLVDSLFTADDSHDDQFVGDGGTGGGGGADESW